STPRRWTSPSTPRRWTSPSTPRRWTSPRTTWRRATRRRAKTSRAVARRRAAAAGAGRRASAATVDRARRWRGCRSPRRAGAGGASDRPLPGPVRLRVSVLRGHRRVHRHLGPLALAGRAREELGDLLVAGLLEVLVPLAHRAQALGRGDAHQAV